MSKKKVSSASKKGKRSEYKVIAELLSRGFDVFVPVVDDQQIDCVLRRKVAGKISYLDVQIKVRADGWFSMIKEIGRLERR